MNMKQTISSSYADVETACVLKRYYAQLLMMKNRFPMEEGDSIKVLYCWYVHVLQLFATSIKNAFMHFQYAAWPLQHLRDNLNASKYASIDFDKELLTFFIKVLLGQAQECLLEKSLIDHRSNVVVTKLAVHLRDRYQECLRHLENSNLCDYVSSKKFKVRSCTYLLFDNNVWYGYYKLADDHLSSIMKLAEKEDRESMKASISFLADVVVTKLNNAKKENEFIFHDRVPSSQELCEKLEGLCKVRPLSFDPLDISVGGEDLFGALLPAGVIKAVSEYEEEKDRLKREVVERVSRKDDELKWVFFNHAFLVSLRIDEIDLEVDSAAPNFPDMLLERNAALTAQPDAIPKLLENLQRVSDLAREADTKLGELTGRMSDVDLPQITEDEGYKAVKKELDRLTEHHQKASILLISYNCCFRSNNVELHKAIAAHTTNLHLLSLPISELRNKLSGPPINAGSTPEGEALRRLLEKTREMQTQRSSLVQRLTEEINNDNIAKKLLSERDSDHKETYIVELKKHESTKKYIDANLDAQEKILSALTEANADFSEFRKKIKTLLNTRSEHIMTLVTAYDVYCDVCSKVEDGRNFYVKLLDRLNKLAVAVEGIETACKVVFYAFFLFGSDSLMDFGAEKQRREAEKRSQEEKIAAFKQANEAPVLPVQGFDQHSQNTSEISLKNSGTHPWASCLPQQQAQLPPDQLILSKNGASNLPTSVLPTSALSSTSLLERNPEIGMHTITGLQVNQHAPMTYQQGHESVNSGITSMPQAHPMSKTVLEKQALQHSIPPLPQTSHLIRQPPQLASIPASSVSPWHSKVVQNVMQSPWHAGVSVNTLMSGNLPVPPVQLQQFQQSQLLQDHAKALETPHKNVPNVDLLDGLPENNNLPPAMIPSSKSVENQNLLQTCAPSLSSSSETLTLSAIHRLPDTVGNPDEQSQVSRPAAAVMPIQYQDTHSTCTETEQSTSRILPLSDITDPTKFELGPCDKTRLEKRLLHEHIRSGGDTPLPKLDPNDPLNTIDPFWKTR
ncbi:unnamed protein product [Angiostrongylus costaricensis]|uniref:BRO1 domain-containing protein n=1 Tax=Angiostrongylus costaricensis TaxID=334426 RepID=A0A0R3PKM7_ANGCS|nr:unnamed protein product [Angiostrongylus costaricensis]